MSTITIEQIVQLNQLKEDALRAGITVRSSSAPSLNATYSIVFPVTAMAHREMLHLKMTGSGRWPKKHPFDVDIRAHPPGNRTPFFSTGRRTHKVWDMAGNKHFFTAAQYQVFGQAIVEYDTALRQAYMTAALTNAAFVAPSATIEIEV